jgi:hypothetical protein
MPLETRLLQTSTERPVQHVGAWQSSEPQRSLRKAAKDAKKIGAGFGRKSDWVAVLARLIQRMNDHSPARLGVVTMASSDKF